LLKFSLKEQFVELFYSSEIYASQYTWQPFVMLEDTEMVNDVPFTDVGYNAGGDAPGAPAYVRNIRVGVDASP
jgi:hypothetical protein